LTRLQDVVVLVVKVELRLRCQIKTMLYVSTKLYE